MTAINDNPDEAVTERQPYAILCTWCGDPIERGRSGIWRGTQTFRVNCTEAPHNNGALRPHDPPADFGRDGAPS